MHVSNATIARFFFRLANLLEISGENPFKVRAYRKAAETIADLEERLDDQLRRGEDITAIPGIGVAIAGKVRAILETGTFPAYEKMRRQVPESLLELLAIRGLGPARARDLHKTLGVDGVESLQRALEAGRLPEVKGFTPRTEDRIRRSLYEYLAHRGRMLRVQAEVYAESLHEHLSACPAVLRCAVGGSYRRGLETIGDLDVVVATEEVHEVIDCLLSWRHFNTWEKVDGSWLQFVADSDLPAMVVCVPPDRFGAAMHHFSASKAYLRAFAEFADERGFKAAPTGLSHHLRPVKTADEEAFFAAFDLPSIPAELREDGDALRAAQEGRLPHLVTEGDIRGDLHMHTTFTDGRHTILEMAVAAREKGYEYIAITDHTRNVKVAGGLEVEELPAYFEEIDKVNRSLEGITVLKGLDVDILEDGRMDMPDEVMRRLDVVIAAIHSHFDQELEAMTARVLAAIEHPLVDIVAHPSGRLVGQRSPLLLDFDRVFDAARRTGTLLELNANPERLDLHDRHCRIARELGIPVVISTDAHAAWQLENMKRGVLQARRGWLRPEDVFNTRPLAEIRALKAQKRP